MYEKKLSRRYLLEMSASMVIYVALLLASNMLELPSAAGALRTVWLMSPMIGFCLMVWAIARHMRRIDEYMRQTMLETTALAAALTAGLSFSYGFLESAGYPRLSMFVVWPVLCGLWGLLACARTVVKR